MNCTAKIILFTLIMVMGGRTGYSESLYVFYPSPLRPQIMEKELGDACPGVKVTVFGRYKDFSKKAKADVPDAVLAKAPVIDKIGGYKSTLSATRDGLPQEPYILLSVDKPLNPGNMTGAAVGVFDILGRKGMKQFIATYLKSSPKIKRVSKMEDLLQLMILNMADAVLIPEVYVPYYQGMSKLNFAVTPVPGMQVDILTLAVKEGGKAPLSIKGLREMDGKTNALLEVDHWK